VKKLEERMAAAARAAEDPGAARAMAVLRDALRAKQGVLVAIGARVIGRGLAEELVDELAPAFARLCEKPIERDPGCRGKVAIARALHDIDRWVEDVFAPGARLVQREPVWGGTEDTAAELRGICAIAYAHAGREEALDVAATLLADKERTARIGAAQALGDSGRLDATALLRFKVITGDGEPEVIAACFAALFVLAPARSLEFAAEWLDDDARGETAALALGESRLEGAFPVLARWIEGAPGRARVGSLALALMRSDAANDLLVERIRVGSVTDAVAAIRALATFKDSTAERVRAAASKRREREVKAALDDF
jgi:hypothetical protein